MDCSTSGFPVHHHLLEFAQTHFNWVCDAIQPSHPLLPPSPPAFSLSQYQGLFQWVGSSNQVGKLTVLEKTLESSLDSMEFKPVNFNGNQLWIFIGRTDAEAEAPILWRRADSLEKTPMLGKTEGRRRRGGRGWDGWMASPAQWTWVWVNSRR